jgi:hypothetical protein
VSGPILTRRTPSSHCHRDPSTVGCCGGTDETCDCECNACRCPNCGKLHAACACVRHYTCVHCKLTPEDAAGGACAALAGPDHEWGWSF